MTPELVERGLLVFSVLGVSRHRSSDKTKDIARGVVDLIHTTRKGGLLKSSHAERGGTQLCAGHFLFDGPCHLLASAVDVDGEEAGFAGWGFLIDAFH